MHGINRCLNSKCSKQEKARTGCLHLVETAAEHEDLGDAGSYGDKGLGVLLAGSNSYEDVFWIIGLIENYDS